jgi:uncharacterized protein (DUF302 family)
MPPSCSSRAVLIRLFVYAIISLTPYPVTAADDPVVTTKIEGDFHDVANSVRMAIIGKGINIAHELPASEMLNRTGPAYGYTTNTYKRARTFEFCSAEISQKLARQHPDNIVLCPFTISVYTLSSDPKFVRLSYRKPSGRPGSEAIVEEVISLINSIIEDATW